MVRKRFLQRRSITVESPTTNPVFISARFKIANLRPVERDLEKNRVIIPAKCVKRPYFRAYENYNKAFTYRHFLKIATKLST